MSLPLLFTIALAGAAGAVARFSVKRLLERRCSRAFWNGTNLVNVSGSFALGIMLGLALSHEMLSGVTTLTGVGFLGAYTTFSTWMLDTIGFAQSGAWKAAIMNIFIPAVAGPAAAFAGMCLGVQF